MKVVIVKISFLSVKNGGRKIMDHIYYFVLSVQFSSVAQSCLTHCEPMNHSTPGLPVHHQLPEFTQTQVIESVIPSSHLILCHPLLLLPQSFPAAESFPMSQHFTWGGQSTGVSASASFPPKKSQVWSPSEDWLDLAAVQGTLKSLQKQQFFSAQLSSQSNSHIHTWTTVKTIA